MERLAHHTSLLTLGLSGAICGASIAACQTHPAGPAEREGAPVALFASAASATPATAASAPVKTPPASPHAVSAAPRPLRIATWNLAWLSAKVGHGPVRRSERGFLALAQMADRLAADVIAVQEVEGERAVARVFDPAKYVAFIADHAGAQDVGFVVRRGLSVTRQPDLVELDVGGLRPGADIELTLGTTKLRLLAVHLKSGCFSGPLDQGKACKKLKAQLGPLEDWIDAREREGVPYGVLGDLNRQLFSTPRDPVWSELDDDDPKGLDLWSPTEGHMSQCWDGKHPEFVDHLLLGASLRALAPEPNFQQWLYAAGADPRQTSDHCPLSIELAIESNDVALNEAELPRFTPPTAPSSVTAPSTATTAPESTPPNQLPLIKGNLSTKGKKLYHLPHCPSYQETKIEPARGERWFTSEDEARAAGWIKAGNCR